MNKEGEVGEWEEDVEDTEGGREEVSGLPLLLVDLVQMFAVKKYNWEEPHHRDLSTDYR